MTLTALIMLAAFQDAGQAIEIAPDTPPPAATADDWRKVASSATRAYLVNTGGKREAGGVITVEVAVVPVQVEDPNDRGYLLDTYEVRCSADEYRVVRTVDVLPDGSQDAPFEDAEAGWEKVGDAGVAPGVKQLACGEADTEEGYASLAEFMAKR